MFFMLSILIPEALFVLGEQFSYALQACLLGETCYILQPIYSIGIVCIVQYIYRYIALLLQPWKMYFLVYAKESWSWTFVTLSCSLWFYLLASPSELLPSPAVLRLNAEKENKKIIEMQQLEIQYLRNQIQEKGQSPAVQPLLAGNLPELNLEGSHKTQQQWSSSRMSYIIVLSWQDQKCSSID